MGLEKGKPHNDRGQGRAELLKIALLTNTHKN